MFNKNINSLNSNLGFRQLMLETQIDITLKNIKAGKSQSGHFITFINNVPLDSFVNPMSEALQIFEKNVDKDLLQNDVVFIFGLGLGYLLKRVFVETSAKIILFEPDKYVARFAFEYVDFSDIFSSNRVFISNDMSECLQKLNDLYIEKEKVNFIFNNEYLTLYTSNITTLSSKIINTIKSKKNDVQTLRCQSKLWINNFLKNFDKFTQARPLNYIENKFQNQNALILCAGPSLKDNLEFIKNNQDKFLIFAVNKISDFLLKNDIIPDFVVISDAVNIKDGIDIDNPKYKNVNFVLSAKCNPVCFDISAKSIWIYFPKNSNFITYLINNTDKSLLFDKTSGTTSIYAYECAKMMGVKNTVLAGLDLAFKGDERYSADVEKQSENIKNKVKFTNVKNFLGEIVQTRNDYALFINQFEHAIEENNDLNVYNLTSFGAFIEGMHYVKSDELFEKICVAEKQLCNIADFVQSCKSRWIDTHNSLKVLINQDIIDAKELLSYKFVESKPDFYPIMYYECSLNFVEFLKMVVKNQLLGEYFQFEILDFLNKFETVQIADEQMYNTLKENETHFIALLNAYIATL